MSRFPTLTETFVLYEILELERLGLQVEIFPLIREKDPPVHPESAPLVERANYQRLLSWSTLNTQIYWLRKRPGRYLSTLWQVITGNIFSPNFLARSMVVMPIAAVFSRKIEAMGIEHLHAHFATHAATAAFVVHRLTGVPYSITAHAHDIYVNRTMLGEKLSAAKFIITISEYNRRLLENLYGVDVGRKTHVIHCGVDSGVFQPTHSPIANEKFTVACIAGLREMKGQRYLLEACARLMRQNLKFQCLLVGSGEDQAALESLIRQLKLENHVHLLGGRSRQEINEIMNRSDVVALPSVTLDTGKMEGIPVALMEAMAVAKPVISTRISGIPELVENGISGLLVPERDVDALVTALTTLAGDPQMRVTMGENGRKRVLDAFDLKKNTHHVFELLSGDGSLPV